MNTDIHKEIIQAPYKFDDQEIAAMNADLRRHLTQIKLLEGQASAAAKDFKLRIQNEENSVELICAKLDAGEENRRMEVAVRFDPSRGMKQYFEEYDEVIREFFNLIREEPMQPADWELPLFKDDVDAPTQEPAEGELLSSAEVQELLKEAKDAFAVGNHVMLDAVFNKLAATFPKQFKSFHGFKKDIEEALEQDVKNSAATAGGQDAGATPIGDVLDQAAAATEAPKILIEHFRDGQWQPKALHTEFWIAAGKAGWTEAQRSTISSLLWENANGKEKLRSVDEMRKILAPHVIGEEASNA